jgi:hypothetical protein
MKFGRTYTLSIQTNPLTLAEAKLANPTINEIVIKNPFTIRFNVTTSLLSSAHVATITVYNLGKTTRDLIFKDVIDPRVYRRITLSAGYAGREAVIFRGNIMYASSTRHGTEWQTTINCFDGGFGISNGVLDPPKSYSGQLATTIIKDLVKSMPGLKLKYISPISNTIDKGVYLGNSWEYVVDLWNSYTYDQKTDTYGHVYIDREDVFLTTRNEVLNKGIVNISAKSGLLDTPDKFDTRINIKMLFEPFLQIGQLINVISTVPEANGNAKIVAMNHIGTISDAVGGELITTLDLWNGENQPFEAVILS